MAKFLVQGLSYNKRYEDKDVEGLTKPGTYKCKVKVDYITADNKFKAIDVWRSMYKNYKVFFITEWKDASNGSQNSNSR